MLEFVLIGMALGGLLSWLLGRLFGGGSKAVPVEGAKPAGWTAEINNDLKTVSEDLGNLYNHAYITRHYLKDSTGSYVSPESASAFLDLLDSKTTTREKFLLIMLAYEELNYSIGGSNRDLFNKWKNLINTVKGDLPTGTSAATGTFNLSTVISNKLRAFYLSAVKAYIIGEFNSVSARASSAPYLWTAPGSGLQGTEFFADSIWSTYSSAKTELGNLLNKYVAFAATIDVTPPQVTELTDPNAPKLLEKTDVLASVNEKGFNNLTTLLTESVTSIIKFTNYTMSDSVLASLTS